MNRATGRPDSFTDAAFLYATLPVSIGLFVWRYAWLGSEPEADA